MDIPYLKILPGYEAMINNGICEELRCWNETLCTHPDIYKAGNCNFLIWFTKDIMERTFMEEKPKQYLDKEAVLQWMREMRAHFDKVYNDKSVDQVIRAGAGERLGLILAMGLEIRDGRFDVKVNAVEVGDSEEIYKNIDLT
jgi:hypothetical protein